jgi:hypothetical protein
MPALGIGDPCSARWDDMPGNDKVRHCPQCKLGVYNFSGMTTVEISQIVAGRTDSDGESASPDLPAGPYELVHTANGFSGSREKKSNFAGRRGRHAPNSAVS